MITKNDFTRTMARDLARYYLKWDEQFTRLQQENARFRETLSIYAEPNYWRATQGEDQEYIFCESAGTKVYVQGKAARAALEGKE